MKVIYYFLKIVQYPNAKLLNERKGYRQCRKNNVIYFISTSFFIKHFSVSYILPLCFNSINVLLCTVIRQILYGSQSSKTCLCPGSVISREEKCNHISYYCLQILSHQYNIIVLYGNKNKYVYLQVVKMLVKKLHLNSQAI